MMHSVADIEFGDDDCSILVRQGVYRCDIASEWRAVGAVAMRCRHTGRLPPRRYQHILGDQRVQLVRKLCSVLGVIGVSIVVSS